MHKSELHEALSKLRAPDELTKEVLLMDDKKKTRCFTRINIRRVLIVGGLILVLMASVLVGGLGEGKDPLFAVMVQAEGGELVEILGKSDYLYSAISTAPNHGPNELDKYLESGRPSANEKYEENRRFLFTVKILRELDYHELRVFRNGEEVWSSGEWNAKGRPDGYYYILHPDMPEKVNLYEVGEKMKEKSVFKFNYFDKNDDLIMCCVVSIIPQEGGYQITIEETEPN